MKPRIYLSPPHMGGTEKEYVEQAFDSNWIAPVGPHLSAFEEEFADTIGGGYALALSSGTAALHLALLEAGVGVGDEVWVPSLTFAGSVFPIRYVGAQPVFVDSERESWNLDPALVADALAARARQNHLPKAIVVVHLYGQTANLEPLIAECQRYGIALIEDAAEALGALYRRKSPGLFGDSGIFSFNGNKIITTSGGGMLVSRNADLIAHARKLATQAREPAVHYEHTEIGYNYRMSNVLAGIGRGQLRVLADRVAARRRNFATYEQALARLPGLRFMPEADWGRHSRWLTTLTIEPQEYGTDRDAVRQALEAENVEARPVWKPMHMQPVFAGCKVIGGSVAESLYKQGLCLPSGSDLSREDLDRVIAIVTSCQQQLVEPTEASQVRQ